MNLTGPQPIVKTRAIVCPNCGGSVQLRGYAHTLVVTCTNCRTLLDTSSGEASILAKAQSQLNIEPTIPLGTRGTFEGVPYEVIGFEQRYTTSGGEIFYWQEYVLFHPYKGFRYLSEYLGHWNFIRPTEVLPFGQFHQTYDGRRYRPFQKATARTSYVIGEFPWRVEVGEAVEMMDYIAPPYILSSEKNVSETTWSAGVYMTGKEIWKTFQMSGSPPPPEGTYANQPNPFDGKPTAYFKLFGIFLLLALAILIFFAFLHKSDPVYTGSFRFDPTLQADQSAVSPPFEIDGAHSTAVHIESRASVAQNWIYLQIALVNKDTNESFDFGETVSYYSGVDGGESWSEGSTKQGTTVHSVPPGHYYIRIDPYRDREAGESVISASRAINYQVAVFEGATNYGLFFIVLLLLLPPPLFVWWRHAVFETRRWAESDLSGGGGDDE